MEITDSFKKMQELCIELKIHVESIMQEYRKHLNNIPDDIFTREDKRFENFDEINEALINIQKDAALLNDLKNFMQEGIQRIERFIDTHDSVMKDFIENLHTIPANSKNISKRIINLKEQDESNRKTN